LCKLEIYSYILQVAEEIWVCENGTVTKWQGDIQTYKEHLKEKIVKDKASSKKQFK
jgi:ATP-binding cassette subfamily F protein 2